MRKLILLSNPTHISLKIKPLTKYMAKLTHSVLL